jgi:hypothetical protein
VQVRAGLISFALTLFRRKPAVRFSPRSQQHHDAEELRTFTLTEPARIAAKQLVAVAPRTPPSLSNLATNRRLG